MVTCPEYFNDVIMFYSSYEDHCELLEKMFKLLQEAGGFSQVEQLYLLSGKDGLPFSYFHSGKSGRGHWSDLLGPLRPVPHG